MAMSDRKICSQLAAMHVMCLSPTGDDNQLSCMMCLVRWPFLEPQQQVFINSLLDLQIAGIARVNVNFISATLQGQEQQRRLLLEDPAHDRPLSSLQVHRVLQQTLSGDEDAVQSVTAVFGIQMPNATATHAIATELYVATANGTLAVRGMTNLTGFCVLCTT